MEEQLINQAKRLLVFYFRTAWESAGCQWHPDNTTEVEIIIDNLVEFIRMTMQAAPEPRQ